MDALDTNPITPAEEEYEAKMAELGRQVPDQGVPVEPEEQALESPQESAQQSEAPLEDASQDAKEAEDSQEEKQPNLPADSFNAFTSEYDLYGKLSDASYEKLANEHGIPREIVDAYIAGQELQQTQAHTSLVNTVGGEDAFKQMTQWAGENLTDKELNAYNQQVGLSQESATMALQWLQQRYESAVGTTPALISGSPNNRPQVKGFASSVEMQEAMRDPRYGKDSAYTAEVEQKLTNRTFHI